MKKLVNNLRGKSLLCSLCLMMFWGLFEGPYNSFLFLGEPEVPEILKED